MKRYIYVILCLLAAGIIQSCVEDPKMPDDIKNALAPEVTTGSVSNETATSVTISGTVTKENGAPATLYGFVWGTKDPVTLENKVDSMHVQTADSQFSAIIAGLDNKTKYYIAAFAGNVAGITVGKSVSFTTKEGLGSMITLPVNMDSVKAESAVVGGEIVDPGESAITSRGVYYWKDGSTKKDTVYSTMQTDSFTCRLTGLSPDTKYFVLAFATNMFGTIEGDSQKDFETPTGQATLTTFEKLHVDYTYADFKATVSKEGDAPVTGRGFCYNTEPNPTIANDTVFCGTGLNEFSGRIENLLANKKYYVRAFAVNSYGVVYSNITFEVITKNDYPTVALMTATLGVIPGTANVSGEVQAQGNSPIATAGVCWSSSTTNPVIGTSNSQSFTTTLGAFEGTLTGLRGGRNYYIRAFASNGTNTSYSNEVYTVTTPPVFNKVASFTDGDRTPGSAAYFVLRDSAFYFGGNTGAAYTNKLWRYAVSEGMLEQWACPDKMGWTSAVSVNFSAFVFGGRNESNQLTNNFYNYSVMNNHWEKLPVTSGPTPVARTAGCLMNMKLYFVGGIRNNASSVEVVSDEIWQYDVYTKAWTLCSPFPVPQYGGFSVVANNIMYSGFGITNIGTSPVYSKKLLKSTDDLATSWTEETTMPGGNIVACVIHKNQLFVVDDLHSIWWYDFATKVWKQKSQLPDYPVHCMYSIGDYIYIGMGTNKALIAYDPTWDN